MKYFSTFSGIGGLDYGLKDIAECVGISEIKSSSVKVYHNNLGYANNYGDITGSAQSRERIFFLGSKDKFSIKKPVIVDDTKRFRDIKDLNGPYKRIKETESNINRIEQKTNFSFELIGGYDRVGTLTTGLIVLLIVKDIGLLVMLLMHVLVSIYLRII